MNLLDTFANPPRQYTLVPFWFWNDELTEAELLRQIDDFEAHGVYGFVPHARIGLPETIGFMSDAYLHFLKVAVDYAASKHMMVILYDEGMYPSGSCAGQVVAANPRHATRCVEQRAPGPLGEDEYLVYQDERFMYVHRRSFGTIRGVHYGQDDGQPGAPPSADILNPESVASFLHLVHDRHYEALQEHFGSTIPAIFTDEPSTLGRDPKGRVAEWTWGFETYLENFLGYDFRPHLETLFDKEHPERPRYRPDWLRAVSARLQEAYYAPYSKWCVDHGIALTGHPAQPGDIGHLRYFQWPGQDIVWRYIEPFKPSALEGDQSATGKCSSSAQRNWGRARNLNEFLGAYGWNLTYEEMVWLTNWLLVRGVNLLSPHAFYYSVRGPRRDERPPDVGPNNTWWDKYKPYADYCRRMCWILSEGEHICDIAILGSDITLPWRAAKELFQGQRDFNYLDGRTILETSEISAEGIRIGKMFYKALIVDGADLLTRELHERLQPLIQAGGVIPYLEGPAGLWQVAQNGPALLEMLTKRAAPDLTATPATPDLRYTHVRIAGTDLYFLVNEGPEPFTARINVSAQGERQWWDPWIGGTMTVSADGALTLQPYASAVLAVSRTAGGQT